VSDAPAASDAPADVAPATLVITRDTPDDVQDRWVRIVIDDGPEEILRYGHVLTRQLPPGRHTVKAHNTLSADKLEFAAAPGQTVRVRCFNTVAKGGILMLMATGFAFISVRLELQPDAEPASAR
jgi:hypothetical protein